MPIVGCFEAANFQIQYCFNAVIRNICNTYDQHKEIIRMCLKLSCVSLKGILYKTTKTYVPLRQIHEHNCLLSFIPQYKSRYNGYAQ